VFACSTEAAARRFLESQPTRASDVVYLCEVVNAGSELFSGDLGAVDDPLRYWEGLDRRDPRAELVLDADLRIIRRA
jgi:hypothetical protein